jgi:hypothetical protein
MRKETKVKGRAKVDQHIHHCAQLRDRNLTSPSNGLVFTCGLPRFTTDAFDGQIIAWAAVVGSSRETLRWQAWLHIPSNICLHSKGNKGVCSGPQSGPTLRAGRQPSIKRYVEGFRQNPETRLYASRIPDADKHVTR